MNNYHPQEDAPPRSHIGNICSNDGAARTLYFTRGPSKYHVIPLNNFLNPTSIKTEHSYFHPAIQRMIVPQMNLNDTGISQKKNDGTCDLRVFIECCPLAGLRRHYFNIVVT